MAVFTVDVAPLLALALSGLLALEVAWRRSR